MSQYEHQRTLSLNPAVNVSMQIQNECSVRGRDQRLSGAMKKSGVTFHENAPETAHRRPEEHGGGGRTRKPALAPASKPKQTMSQLSAQEWHKTHKIKWVAPSAVKHLRKQALGPMGYDQVEWPDWDPMGDGGVDAPQDSRRTGRITHAMDLPNIVTTNQGKNAFSVMQFYELGCELWRPVAPPLPSIPSNNGGGPKSPKGVLRKPTARVADVLITEGGEGGGLPPLRGGALRNRRKEGNEVSYEGTQGDMTRKGTIRLSWDSKHKVGWTRMKTPGSGRTSPVTPKVGGGQKRGDVLQLDVERYLPKIASRFGKAIEGEVLWQKHRKMMSRRYAVSRRGKRMLVSDLMDGGISNRSGIKEIEGGAGPR